MSFFDLFSLILENLGRRKARVALTAIGVVIGTAAVVVLVSLAIGLQQNATQSLWGIGDLTQITVWPNYGDYYPGDPAAQGKGQPNQKLLTDSALAELAAIPGVAAVIPRDYMFGGGMIYFNRLETWANINGIGTTDVGQLGVELQDGSLTLGKGQMVIGAMVARNFMDPKLRPGQEPPPPPDLLGQTLRLVLIKWDQDGMEIKKTYQVKVVGVLKEARSDADWSMYMPMDDVTAMNEWYMGKRINRKKDGYSQVQVKADKVDNVLTITETITNLGYQAHAPQSYVQGINSFFLIMQVIFGGVGAIALLVAAIGIANTMAMAILERTREIGLMKAVGATNRDVLSVFLGEAAGIGFLGGAGGVLLGWSAGQVINVLAMAYMAGQAAQQGGPPPGVAVVTPAWLPLFALGFATLVGLISGLYPALRAATLVPVTALKYE